MTGVVWSRHAAPRHERRPIVAASASIIIDGPCGPSSPASTRCKMAVVTVGALHAVNHPTMIPQNATLELSVRALDRDVRSKLEQRIKADPGQEALSGERRSTGGAATQLLVNTETAFARDVALALVGPGAYSCRGPAVTGSELRLHAGARPPGGYLLIGNGDGDGCLHGAQPWLRLQRRQPARRCGLRCWRNAFLVGWGVTLGAWAS
jgi:hippurate hydrolase